LSEPADELEAPAKEFYVYKGPLNALERNQLLQCSLKGWKELFPDLYINIVRKILFMAKYPGVYHEKTQLNIGKLESFIEIFFTSSLIAKSHEENENKWTRGFKKGSNFDKEIQHLINLLKQHSLRFANLFEKNNWESRLIFYQSWERKEKTSAVSEALLINQSTIDTQSRCKLRLSENFCHSDHHRTLDPVSCMILVL